MSEQQRAQQSSCTKEKTLLKINYIQLSRRDILFAKRILNKKSKIAQLQSALNVVLFLMVNMSDGDVSMAYI